MRTWRVRRPTQTTHGHSAGHGTEYDERGFLEPPIGIRRGVRRECTALPVDRAGVTCKLPSLVIDIQEG